MTVGGIHNQYVYTGFDQFSGARYQVCTDPDSRPDQQPVTGIARRVRVIAFLLDVFDG